MEERWGSKIACPARDLWPFRLPSPGANRAGERNLLRQRELHVAGARRHVDDERVEFAPGDLAQHLRQRLRHHRAAPDHRHVFVDEKADRHHFDAVGLQRDHLAVGHLRLAMQAE